MRTKRRPGDVIMNPPSAKVVSHRAFRLPQQRVIPVPNTEMLTSGVTLVGSPSFCTAGDDTSNIRPSQSKSSLDLCRATLWLVDACAPTAAFQVNPVSCRPYVFGEKSDERSERAWHGPDWIISRRLFLAALATALIMTPIARRIAVRLGAVDRPNPRRINKTPVRAWAVSPSSRALPPRFSSSMPAPCSWAGPWCLSPRRACRSTTGCLWPPSA